jgi:hypothetical protein
MNGEKLKGQWGHKGSASTEDLRLALRRYCLFFGRPLSVWKTWSRPDGRHI